MSKFNFAKIRAWIIAHKIWSSVIAIVILFLGYKIYQSFTTTSGQMLYLTEPASRGTIISTVTGSGQVSASNQVEIKSKVSGTIVGISAIRGGLFPKALL